MHGLRAYAGRGSLPRLMVLGKFCVCLWSAPLLTSQNVVQVRLSDHTQTRSPVATICILVAAPPHLYTPEKLQTLPPMFQQ